jgi:hypothetical protein
MYLVPGQFSPGNNICPTDFFYCQCITHFNSFYFYFSSISHHIVCTDLFVNPFCIVLSHNLSFGRVIRIRKTKERHLNGQKMQKKKKKKTSKCSNPTFPGMLNVDIMLSLYERIRKFPNV